MSLTFFSWPVFMLGAIALAVGLWLAQRLRVQHREVEVNSTLFWQAAIEEKRVRVFVRRFRHWPAWCLLVLIAGLIWMLLGDPATRSLDGVQHVVLIDSSQRGEQRRQEDLQVAVDYAAGLPRRSREIVAANEHLQTLVECSEPLPLAALRYRTDAPASADGVLAAIHTLSARASAESPMAIHLVGAGAIDQELLSAVGEHVTIDRVQTMVPDETVGLIYLGLADSPRSHWNTVDVDFGFADQSKIDPTALSISLNEEDFDPRLEAIGNNQFRINSVPASGGVLTIRKDGEVVGSLTIPNRDPISVSLTDEVPESLRELVLWDQACEIVTENAEVRIGFDDTANFVLTDQQGPAFFVEDDGRAEQELPQLVDQLALKQVDAMSLAEQSGQVIDVQFSEGTTRKIGLWASLFSDQYDFDESRACPIFVANSIRWLAGRPELVPWAERGQRLPVAAVPLSRATGAVATTSDGQKIQTVRLKSAISTEASLAETTLPGWLRSFSLSSWIGLLVLGLLTLEWTLYQRGRMP